MPIVFDIIVALILLASTIVGFRRGFVTDSVYNIGFIVATVLALLFSRELGNLLFNFESQVIKTGIGFVLIFATTVFVTHLIGNYFGGRMRDAGLGPADRTVGVLFGFIRGVVIVVVALVFLMQSIVNSTIPESSYSYPILAFLEEEARPLVASLLDFVEPEPQSLEIPESGE